MKNQLAVPVACLGVLTSLLICLPSCSLGGRQKQIDSFSRVAAAAATLERLRAKGVRVDGFPSEVAGKVDGWGRELQVLCGDGEYAGQYVLISLGRDGRADFGSREAYFVMQKEDIRGLLDRDIVYRNGEWVTNAGKDPHSEYPRRD